MSTEIDTRIGNAWKCYWGLKEIMKNTETKMAVKSKQYNTCILWLPNLGAHYKKKSPFNCCYNIDDSDRVRELQEQVAE
ncbi:unnamed protein product [Colias eurytheme]|nr:unnamed protein product [Colias eurytheme]